MSGTAHRVAPHHENTVQSTEPVMSCLSRLSVVVVLIGTLSPTKAGAQQEDKVVRLIWFPRFSPDGNWLASAHGSWDGKEGGEVRVWDAKTGKPKSVIPVD